MSPINSLWKTVGSLAPRSSALLFACGCSVNFSTYDGGGNASNTGYETGTTEGASSESVVADGSADISTSLGEVLVIRETLPAAGTSATFARARFAVSEARTGCETQIMNTCSILTCPLSSAVDSGALPNVSAGTITITGGSGPIAMVPDVNAAYDYSSWLPLAGPTVAGGSALGVAASGGAVPPFTGSVTMPDDLVLTTPVLSATPTNPVVFSRAVDTPVAWTGGESGNVYMIFGQLTVGGGVWISCSFPAANGSGTVPAAALARLAAADANGMPSTSLDIVAEKAVLVTRAGWRVRVVAQNPAFGGPVTIQ